MLKSVSEKLIDLGFVPVPHSTVQLGTENPLKCRLEGHRLNETPVRYAKVTSFWVARHLVTNAEFERWRPRYRRPLTSPRDRQPVTDVTYLEALMYADWQSEENQLPLSLPTEPQWVAACGGGGLREFPWGDSVRPDAAWTRESETDGPLDVDDERCGVNDLGLVHAVGNVQQLLLGTNYAGGTDGASTDGMYCLFKGGDWRHCRLSAGVARRGLMDVASRLPTVGFRLVANA